MEDHDFGGLIPSTSSCARFSYCLTAGLYSHLPLCPFGISVARTATAIFRLLYQPLDDVSHSLQPSRAAILRAFS